MAPYMSSYEGSFESYHQLTKRSHSLGPTIIGVQWMIVILAFLVYSCRIYVRLFRNRTAGWDDLTISIAMALSLFGGATATIFADNGIGTHINELTLPEIKRAVEWLVIGVFQSYLALFFIRLSIAIFIVRMLTKAQFRLKLAVYFCLFLNFAVTVMIITILGMWCRPLKGVWDKTVKAKCLTNETLTNANRAFASISAATDIVYSLLPIAVFWRLQMNTRLKVNLAVIMSFTLVICACAIGKAATVDENGTDTTYENGKATFWAVFEVNLGIIVASLPGVRQFYIVTRHDIQSIRSRSSGQRSTQQSTDALGERASVTEPSSMRHASTSSAQSSDELPLKELIISRETAIDVTKGQVTGKDMEHNNQTALYGSQAKSTWHT